MDADIIVVGAGLAGLVAAAEAADRGKRVLLLDQEGEQNLGGQAHWSFGGLLMVDTPEQRRLGIRDSRERAGRDWAATAGHSRPEDQWGRRWAESYLDFAAGEMRAWLRRHGMRFFPVVGWAERGGLVPGMPGNSVPRFHVTWGTGPGVVAPFVRRVQAHAAAGRIVLGFRHRVTGLDVAGGAVCGVRGEVLEPSARPRGEASSRVVVGDFLLRAGAVVVTSGGIGGNHKLVRQFWPADRLGPAPATLISGVPRHVDGLLQAEVAAAGARLVNTDRMWHYTEGLRNWNPIWPAHGIRILPGPSALWLDPQGARLPAPNYPGFDTLGTLGHLGRRGFGYSWFVLNRALVKKEWTLSGSEQNPDLTGRSWPLVARRLGRNVSAPVRAFLDRGADFVQADTPDELLRGMAALTGDGQLDPGLARREMAARDREIGNPDSTDPQVAAIHRSRQYLSERLMRVAKPEPLLAAGAGPLVAVRLNILTRKSLGGLETDLSARVLGEGGVPIPGLYAAGEVAGFGGGGLHGERALEGTFLGGCLYGGRVAGRAAGG